MTFTRCTNNVINNDSLLITGKFGTVNIWYALIDTFSLIDTFWYDFAPPLIDTTKIFNFSPKFLFLIKISIFHQTFHCWQNFDFPPKLPFFNKISIFDQNFHFSPNFQFSTKVKFLTKFPKFAQNFDFWSHLNFRPKFPFRPKFKFFSQTWILGQNF